VHRWLVCACPWKTVLQMFSLGFFIVGDASPEAIPSILIGDIFLGVAAALTLWTGYDYLRSGLLHATALDDQSASKTEGETPPQAKVPE
ncbi:MAG: hypothetical protein OSB69_21380, partial [Alphaproteobacteria bacterium]|nr:hypothetical protein [Alphaproteobacteria bacterium]